MAKIDGGELFVRTLKQAGVKQFFTLHGGHLDAIFQACLNHDIPVLDNRHEAAAGHAAEGYARSTGKLGVALVTAGPGFANVVTSVVNAWLDGVPVLYVAGAPPLRDAETNPLQGGFDQVAMMAPTTKFAHRITQTHRIPNLVAHAARIATSGRPGPVFLEIPIDVLFSQVNEDAVTIPQTIIIESAPAPGGEAVARALALLHSAERPVIMAGAGMVFSGVTDELRLFAEATGTPVFTNAKAHGFVPGSHALFCGGFANMGLLTADGPGRPDVVLLMGARMGMMTAGITDAIVPAEAKLVQVDIDGREMGRLKDVEVPIVADCRETLLAFSGLAAEMDWPDRGAWREACHGAGAAHKEQFAEVMGNKEAPIHPYQAAAVIADFIDKDAIIAADGGETFTWLESVVHQETGPTLISLGYLGCLGTGMGFAIGAKKAFPDRQVVCVVGDGAIGFNISEFDTMVRHQLPIVTIVLNNQSWGMSLHGQELMYGRNRLIVTELDATRYDEVAVGFGCHGELVETIDELVPALERAFASGKPACVNVMTDKWVIAPFTLALMGTWDKEAQIALPYYDNIDA